MNVLAIKKIREGVVDVFVMERNGDCPTLDFLYELKRCDSPDLGQLTNLFDETSQNGVIDYNEYRFKNLKNGLYEFKAYHGARIFCFLDNEASSSKRLVICATAVIKKKRKHAPSDVKEALRWRADYFEAKEAKTLIIENDQ